MCMLFKYNWTRKPKRLNLLKSNWSRSVRRSVCCIDYFLLLSMKILHLWWGCKQKAYNYSTERKKESFVHLKIHNVFMIFSNFCWRWSECCWIISNKRLRGLFNKEPEANTGNCFFYNCSDSWVLLIFFVNSNSVANSFCCYMHVISSNSSFKNFL